EIKDILPSLEEMSKKKIANQGTSISYGITRVRSIFQKAMVLNEEISLWGIPRNIEEILGESFLEGMFMRERGKKKKVTRFLYNKHPDKKPKEKNNLVRFLDREDSSTMVL